jgi:hypothetical protein
MIFEPINRRCYIFAVQFYDWLTKHSQAIATLQMQRQIDNYKRAWPRNIDKPSPAAQRIGRQQVTAARTNTAIEATSLAFHRPHPEKSKPVYSYCPNQELAGHQISRPRTKKKPCSVTIIQLDRRTVLDGWNISVHCEKWKECLLGIAEKVCRNQ